MIGRTRVLVAMHVAAVCVAAQSSTFAGDVIVLPQARSYALTALVAVDVDVAIEDRQAATTVVMSLTNRTPLDQPVEVLVPVPDGAVVRGFDFLGDADAPTATRLERDDACALHRSIVASLRDPALLEFASSRTLRSSVSPVPNGGEQKLSVTYDELLPSTSDGHVESSGALARLVTSMM